MLTLTKLQLSDLSCFSPRKHRIQLPSQLPPANSIFRKHKRLEIEMRDRIFSLPGTFRYLQMNINEDNQLSEQVNEPRKLLRPLWNAVSKIIEQKQQQIARRKSAFGLIYGGLSEKEMQNLPTTIEQHKMVCKQELALTSFAIMLERKQKKKTTRKLTGKLSKQESMVEYDNMERPPSCKTPPKYSLTSRPKLKSKLQQEKEKYCNQQDIKMGHFLSGKQHKVKLIQKNQKNVSFQQHFQTQSYASLPILKKDSFATSPLIQKLNQQSLNSPIRKSSSSVIVLEQAYRKHNTLLLKKIQQISEIKNTTFSQKYILNRILV